MTKEEKFKKDMEMISENLRRTFNPTWYEKIIDEIFFFPNLALLLIIISIIILIFDN